MIITVIKLLYYYIIILLYYYIIILLYYYVISKNKKECLHLGYK